MSDNYEQKNITILNTEQRFQMSISILCAEVISL